MNDERANAILNHWCHGGKVDESTIVEKFGEDLERAKRGELDGWTASAESCVALVILLDQVSRKVHANSGEAFAWDAKAQATVLVSIARGLDAELEPIQRAWFYMPLMHSEDLAVQERAVELYDELGFESFHEMAVRHRDIIERFGRFPHRNELLGRASTAEELAFLQESGEWPDH